jgi:hypothetical protein
MWERIGPRRLERLGITIERLEEPEMCDEKMAVVGRAAGRKAQREHDAKVAADAVRAYQNGSAPKKEHGPAYITLCTVGGIVLLAEMHTILHALTIVLIIAMAIGAVAALAFVTRGSHLPRRRRVMEPAPDPELTGRTVRTVTSVTVRSLPGPPEQGSDTAPVAARRAVGHATASHAKRDGGPGNPVAALPTVGRP